mmetsp:Transcript_18530/g.31642  ORF Transcript_18530/g.31642 Transcript_18530/m.31642 type:complete len:253 (+) Transcript_18530:1043-1801(+)
MDLVFVSHGNGLDGAEIISLEVTHLFVEDAFFFRKVCILVLVTVPTASFATLLAKLMHVIRILFTFTNRCPIVATVVIVIAFRFFLCIDLLLLVIVIVIVRCGIGHIAPAIVFCCCSSSSLLLGIVIFLVAFNVVFGNAVEYHYHFTMIGEGEHIDWLCQFRTKGFSGVSFGGWATQHLDITNQRTGGVATDIHQPLNQPIPHTNRSTYITMQPLTSRIHHSHNQPLPPNLVLLLLLLGVLFLLFVQLGQFL